MKRWLLLLTSACLATGCRGLGKDSTWTVMSWNVQNLFDGASSGEEYPEFDPSRGEWNERLYKRRLERVGRIVFEAEPKGPDLLVLQEIEHEGVLNDLATGSLKKAGYDWRLVPPGTGAIRCGILSRYPISETKVVECGHWRERNLRPILAFTVETPLGPVFILALHWKSPRDGRAATEEARLREASAVKSLIDEYTVEQPAVGIIALGDLNTPGDGGVVPAALAPWSDSFGPDDGAILYRTSNTEIAGIRDGERILFDPEPSSGPPGTYWFRGRWDRPDRALLTETMLDEEGPAFLRCYTFEGSMCDGSGHPVRWKTDLEEGYSDHLPLFLVFREKTSSH